MEGRRRPSEVAADPVGFAVVFAVEPSPSAWTLRSLAPRRAVVVGDPGTRPSERAWWGFIALAFLLSLLSHLPLATAPFGQGIADVNSGRYQGGIQRAYEKLGFWELGGAPYVSPLPSKTVRGRVYLNHPPLLNWVNRLSVVLIGYTELGLRAYPILCSAILAAILAWFAGVHGGAFAALAAAVLYAALPMTTIYGSSSDWEGPTLLFSVLALLFLASESLGRRLFGLLWLALAVLHDWVGGFTLLGLMLHLYGSGRRQYWGILLAGGVTCALSVGFCLVLGTAWAGGFRPALDLIFASASMAAEGSVSFTIGSLLSAQVDHTMAQFGWMAMLLVTASLPWALSRRRYGGDPMAGMILCWTAVAVLYVCAFPGRAINHEVWWYSFTPAVVMAVVSITSACWRSGLRIGAAAALAAVTMATVAPSLSFYDGITSRSKDFAEMLNEQFDERTIVVAPFAGGPYYFYLDAWLIDVTSNPGTMRQLASEFRSGNLDADRLVFLTDPRSWYHEEVIRLAPDLGMERLDIGVGELQVFELRADSTVSGG